MLAVQLEAVESPIDKNLSHQRFVVFHDGVIGRAEIVGIPPGNLAPGAVCD